MVIVNDFCYTVIRKGRGHKAAASMKKKGEVKDEYKYDHNVCHIGCVCRVAAFCDKRHSA